MFFSTRQTQWLARLVDGFHQIQLGFYETEARAIYYGERKRRNPREVDPLRMRTCGAIRPG